MDQDTIMVEKSSKSNSDSVPKIDERSQILSVNSEETEKSRLSQQEIIFLPYGVGPIIDCEIDDESDEPDYLSYSLMPNSDLVEDSSIPGDGMR